MTTTMHVLRFDSVYIQVVVVSSNFLKPQMLQNVNTKYYSVNKGVFVFYVLLHVNYFNKVYKSL